MAGVITLRKSGQGGPETVSPNSVLRVRSNSMSDEVQFSEGLISDNGTVVTIAGNITVTGTLTGGGLSSISPGNPSATVGLAAINGVATTFMRSDAAPALDVSISPTWSGVHKFVGGAPIVFDGATGGTFTTTLNITDPTANRNITLPDTSGTLALLESPTFTTPVLGVATATSLSIGGALGTDPLGLPNVFKAVGGTKYFSVDNIGAFFSSDGTISAYGYPASGTFTFGTYTNFSITFVTNNVARLTLDTSGNGVLTGNFTASAHIVNGTAGSGYLQIANQSSAPGTPTSAGRLYFDSTNRFSWIGTNGFTRTFDGTANTANRIYVLPDLAGTVALTANNLSAFAATTSAQLASVLSDETGTGAAVFADSPTFTTKALFPLGTAGAPGIAFAADPTIGLYSTGSTGVFVSSSIHVLALNATPRIGMRSDAKFGFTGATDSTVALSVTLTRFAAANLQLGDVASATPVAQTLSVQDGAGTDIAGATWTLRASRGTGAGAPGNIILSASAAALGTGSTLQTAVTHLTVGNSLITAAYPVLLSDGTNGAPGIGFSSEPAVGIYKSASGTLAVKGVSGVNTYVGATVQFVLTNGNLNIRTVMQPNLTNTHDLGDITHVWRSLYQQTVILGQGDTSASLTGGMLRGPNASGTDIAAVDTSIQAALGTGAGAVGNLLLKASAAALGTGTTLQTAVTHLTIGTGAIKLGASVNLQQSNGTVRITDGGVFRSSDNTAGANAGPFTTITSITVKDGLVTALTGA